MFKANAVLIPNDAMPAKENSESAVDPDECTLLYLDGDNSFGQCYTQRAWENDEPPSYVRRAGLNRVEVWELDDEGNETRPLSCGQIELLPDLWVVKEDETDYWDEEFRKKYKIERIVGVYVLDRMRHHFLCEITPSYERYFLGSQWESRCRSDKKAGEIDDFVREGDACNEQWSYAHVHDVDRTLELGIKQRFLPPKGKSGGYKLEVNSVRTEDAIKEAQEIWTTSTL